MAMTLLTLRTWLEARIDGERGASLVEYALLVAFIAVVCALAVGVLGGEVSESYSSTASGFG
jgi:pilus assembly protein Flp/PilA